MPLGAMLSCRTPRTKDGNFTCSRSVISNDIERHDLAVHVGARNLRWDFDRERGPWRVIANVRFLVRLRRHERSSESMADLHALKSAERPRNAFWKPIRIAPYWNPDSDLPIADKKHRLKTKMTKKR